MLASERNQIKQWIKRRADRGVTVTADELWTYINKRWGYAPEATREELFQTST